MEDEPTQFLLTLGADADSDDAELAELGRQLRNELLELPALGAVSPVRGGTAPAGAKGDPAIWATLAVTLAPIALTELIRIAQPRSMKRSGKPCPGFACHKDANRED